MKAQEFLATRRDLAKIAKMPYVRSCGISQKCWCEGQKNSKKIETKIADTKDGRAHAVCRPLYTDLNSNPDDLIR
jgi:hypothetical protein